MDLEERGDEEVLGEVVGKGNHSQDILYEKRICFQLKFSLKSMTLYTRLYDIKLIIIRLISMTYTIEDGNS